MAYRCEHCGYTLADDEIVLIKEPHGEEWACCPRCKSSDLEELHQCKKCGGLEEEDDLVDGWCEECLKDMVTADRFKRFGLEDAEPGEASIFEEYVLEWYLGLEPMHRSHPILKEMTVEVYDKYSVHRTSFSDLWTFIRDLYLDEWAEFCTEEVKRDARKDPA